MQKKLFSLLLAFCLCALIPVPVNASSWEDRLDEAWQTGFEEGYSVGWADAECAMEYGDNGYSSNNSYTPDELDAAYQEGYESGKVYYYDQGFSDGETSARNEDENWFNIFLIVAVPSFFAYLFGKTSAEDAAKKEILELKIENIRLQSRITPEE